MLFLDKRIVTMAEFVKIRDFDESQGFRPANKPHCGLFSRHYHRKPRAAPPSARKEHGPMRQIRKTGAFALCLLLSALCLAVGALAAEEPDYSTLTEENGVYRNNQGIVFTLRTDGSNTAWVGIADGDKVRNNSRYSSESENYNGGVVHIPDTVHIEGSTQNYTVTTIARGAFRYNSELTKIEIGSSVTTI